MEKMNEPEAGQELDQAIATEVMGLRVHTFGKGTDAVRVALVYRTDDVNEDGEPLPRYSADIAAAMDVVTRLRALGWKVAMRTQLESAWEVNADSRQYARASWVETLPLAICRVALQCVRMPPYEAPPYLPNPRLSTGPNGETLWDGRPWELAARCENCGEWGRLIDTQLCDVCEVEVPRLAVQLTAKAAELAQR